MREIAVILDELRAIRKEVRDVAVDVELIREAVRSQGARLACLERPTRTPLPLRAVSDSWVPDQGDRGREP